MLKLFGLHVFLAVSALHQQPNWTGPYEPCANSPELKKSGHMSLGVRYDIDDPVIIDQFHRAFDFWSKVVDADFFDDQSSSCAIAIVDGDRSILASRTVVARAQLPDRLNFSGWIAINTVVAAALVDDDAVAVWMHEIGHLLGLKHNNSPTSLMYFMDADATSRLDESDLRALAVLHALRQ